MKSLQLQAQSFAQQHNKLMKEIKIQEIERNLLKLIEDKRYDEDTDEIFSGLKALKVFYIAVW